MDQNEKVPAFGKRHEQMLLLFGLLAINFGIRGQLPVALVAMTEASASPNPDVPTFNWKNKSVILSSFYWGYFWLQVWAGNLGRVYGTKYFLIMTMTVDATIQLLLPTMAVKFESNGVIVCKILQGLVNGFLFPTINNVLSKWSPLSERATLVNIVLSGVIFGITVTSPVVAFITTTWYGWPLSFYLGGVVGYLWVIIFFFFGASSPADHNSISKVERDFIESNLDTEGHKNGFISAVPYLVNFVLTIAFGYLADYTINHNIMSLSWSRKLFTAIGSGIPALALITLGFLPTDATTLSVLMLIIAVGVSSANGAGSLINHIDLSPNFAGVLLGLINGSGGLVSAFGPLAVQFIVTDETNKNQWKIIFIIAALMYILPTILFLLFGSAEVQSFDSDKNKSDTEKENDFRKQSIISILSLPH